MKLFFSIAFLVFGAGHLWLGNSEQASTYGVGAVIMAYLPERKARP